MSSSLENYLSARSRDRHGYKSSSIDSSSSFIYQFQSPKSLTSKSIVSGVDDEELGSWLFKKGPFKTWKQVYARITSSIFSLHADPESLDIIWSIPIVDIKGIKNVDGKNVEEEESKGNMKNRFEILICTWKTEISLAADSSALRSTWIAAFRKRLNGLEKLSLDNNIHPLFSTTKFASFTEYNNSSEYIEGEDDKYDGGFKTSFVSDGRGPVSTIVQDDTEKEELAKLKMEKKRLEDELKLNERTLEETRLNNVSEIQKLSLKLKESEKKLEMASKEKSKTGEIFDSLRDLKALVSAEFGSLSSAVISKDQGSDIRNGIEKVVGQTERIMELQRIAAQTVNNEETSINKEDIEDIHNLIVALGKEINTNVEVVGRSIGKVVEYLASNAESQMNSERAIYDKLCTLQPSSDYVNLEKLKQEINGLSQSISHDIHLTQLKHEDIERIVEVRTHDLRKIWNELKDELLNVERLGNQELVQALEGRLEVIRTGIDQTQSMVLTTSNSADDIFHRLSVVFESLKTCYEDFSALNSEKPQADIQVISQDSVLQHMKEFTETIIKEIKKESHERVPRYIKGQDDQISHHLHVSRARSLSPQKSHVENLQDDQLVQINQTLFALKERLNTFILNQVTDTGKLKDRELIRTVEDKTDKVLKIVRDVQDGLFGSDQAWKTELRQSMRLNHEKLAALQAEISLKFQRFSNSESSPPIEKLMKKMDEVAAKSLNGIELMDAINQIKESIIKMKLKSGDDTNEAFSSLICEALNGLKQSFSLEISRLNVDRERLMENNQKLMSEILNKRQEAGSNINLDVFGVLENQKKTLREEIKELSGLVREKMEKLKQLDFVEIKLEVKKCELEQMEELVSEKRKELLDVFDQLKTAHLRLGTVADSS